MSRGWLGLTLLFAASCNCGRTISGQELATCTPAGPCDAPILDADAGKCIDAFAPDGTACDAGLICQIATQCAAGACVGTPVSCDDSNACTQDTCVEGQGCQHMPVTCQGDNPCQLYSCNPASGCFASGVVTEGTACQLWWEPCVDDARCKAGSCDSPTANAEVPGQVRWQVPLGGAPGPFGPFTIDDAGTSTFILVPDGGTEEELVAVDACGKVRWSTGPGTSVGWPMQDETQLVVGGTDGQSGETLLLALDPATGKTRWTFDLSDLMAREFSDAGPCAREFNTYSLAETRAGAIEALVGFCDLSLIVSLNSQGQLSWIRTTPFLDSQSGFMNEQAANPLVIDGNGDAYLGGITVPYCESAALWAVSPGGQTTFQSPLPNAPPGGCDAPWLMPPTAGAGVTIVTERNGPGFLVQPDGGIAATLPPLSFGDGVGRIYFSSAVQDSDGTLFIPGIPGDAGERGVTAFSPDGHLLWTSSAINGGSLLLTDDGLVFGLEVDEAGHSTGMVAIDAATGTLQVSLEFPEPAITMPVGALTPGASLLAVNKTGIVAVFAGKHRPSATAPWSRWGGDNSNRNSAR